MQNILNHYQQADFITDIELEISAQSKSKIQIFGSIGSDFGLMGLHLFSSLKQDILILLDDKEDAIYALNELEEFLGKEQVLFYPNSARRPYQIEEVNNANVVLRTEVLKKIQSSNKFKILVSYTDAIFEKVVSKKTLKKHTLKITIKDEISVDFLNEVLFSYQFRRVDFVTEPGEFSVRGGIVDIFSYSNEKPYRVSFFGDEVESIRLFEIDTQLSVGKVKSIDLTPNLDDKITFTQRESFLEFLPEKTLILAKNLNSIQEKIYNHYKKAKEIYAKNSSEIEKTQPQELYLQAGDFQKQIESFTCLNVSQKPFFKETKDFHLRQSPQPAFNKQFDLFIEELKQNQEKQYKNYLVCANHVQLKRFEDIFEDKGEDVPYQPVIGNLHKGFIHHDLKLACYTDHELFERYHKFKSRNRFLKEKSLTLKELTHLQIGDYVTHIDHGIGKFAGLQKIDVQGKKQEAIKLFYQNKDILYVSIHSLHKITKYKSNDGIEPKLHKLGSPAWRNLKNKTKKKVKEIAFDLIKLYAKRKFRKGFQYAPDSYLQNELEASFIYEDTPDQLKATQDVKQDMENERSMDRLICGDVGFGKTEIAIRAAFKAAVNGKQVAILVPTTILAFQHYKTFSERLKNMPIKVDYLNRFKTSKERKVLLEELESGKLDVVIGTHQLVNKAIQYKDLGLLIVDEEHKFGVGVKDKLKTFRANIDTLTLTATPIPRTLQFSLMAARDLSIIKTPPPNRQPIETQLIGFNEEQIRDAVSYEIQRGGQVFFIHNRINTLKEVSGMIQRLVPDAKIAIGHGQMDGKKLEEILLNFMSGDYDVFVSTTIVESGLDVSNANTIIINDANQFGLADLHQMRGRVGRSNKKAFCYLITPPLTTLTREARKRLQAIEQFSDLGSGFQIAMKDLEIRGAGNLLGAEQSGFISDIGFDTYQKILNEAIEELKQTEFNDLFTEEKTTDDFVKEFQIDTDLNLLIPDDYVNDVEERLILYNQLNQIENETELITFESQLIDRFGPLPKEVKSLLESIELKSLCKVSGIEKLVLKNKKMLCYFVSNPQSGFYQTKTFSGILQYLQENPRVGKLKEKPAKDKDLPPSLILVIEDVQNIHSAKRLLSDLI